MSDVNPTRSVVVEMKDERRAMHEIYILWSKTWKP